ncbi:MAG: M23 family metallopeptidase [Elusimicrobia bacterium]|nr:M23 family metallopeptidase [Elusimicrobiota bacterium]
MTRRAFVAAALAALALAGCKTGERLTRELLRSTPQGRKLLPQFDRYAKVAHVLRRYHDDGVLDENAALDILREAGVIPRRGPRITRAGGRPPAGPKPFPVPKYQGGWRWPLEAGVVSSEFGARWGKNHHGMDIAADMKAPIYAAAPGKVLYSGDQVSGYGNLVVLRHDAKTTTFYGHNALNKVKTGDAVSAGQVVALLGSTGRSTGPHIHFEYREADKPLNPRTRLPKSGF